MNTRGTFEHSVTVELPKYELIDKDGKVVSEYLSAEAAAKVASWMFPDQEQDPDRTGKGWDIQVCEQSAP